MGHPGGSLGVATTRSQADLELTRAIEDKLGDEIEHFFFSKIVGATLSNSDGSSRSKLLDEVSRMEIVDLIHEPSNPFDVNAVKVVRRPDGAQLGYLTAHVAEDVSKWLARGERVIAVISEIWHAPDSNRALGANILIVLLRPLGTSQ